MLRFPETLSESTFLKEYWQKEPVVLDQGLSEAINIIDKQSLLELSLSEEVESRLIVYEDTDYHVYDGPQNSDHLDDLASHHQWTLLVQSVNLWIPEVAKLLAHFQFIPQWRLDDIMISFATDLGGVGPHTDQYDVFLIQVSGERRWRVGTAGMDISQLNTPGGLKQISPFEAHIERIFKPGDVLYVPPETPHEGISSGECLTLSVGFRSPSPSEFSMMLGEELLNSSSNYRDPDSLNTQTPFEIPMSALQQAEKWFKETINSPDIYNAFAKLQTQPKQELLLEPALDPIKHITSGSHLNKDPASRIAWYETAKSLEIFANGEVITLGKEAKDLLNFICQAEQIDLPAISAYIGDQSTDKLLTFLADVGYLGIVHDQDD